MKNQFHQQWLNGLEMNLPVAPFIIQAAFTSLMDTMREQEDELFDAYSGELRPAAPKHSAKNLAVRAPQTKRPGQIARMLAEDVRPHFLYQAQLLQDDLLIEQIEEMNTAYGQLCSTDPGRALGQTMRECQWMNDLVAHRLRCGESHG